MSQMNTKLLRASALAALLVLGGAAVAQKPVESIDPHRHPHLAAAQHHIVQAFAEAELARTDNHEELGGHDERAMTHLVAADHELKDAAEYANVHPHK